MLRGTSSEAPILLFLEGRPGGTGIGRIRNSGEALEQDFVVAVWDQRGTGKPYDSLEPTETLTLDQMVSDTIDVTRHLLDRFGQQKLYLVGSSWGTIIGTLAVQREPELFHAWVGTGQMVDPFETDQLMYTESLTDAGAHDPASEYPTSLFVGEYTLAEQLRGMAAIAETYHVLYPQLEDIDVPVYLVEGQHETAGRETLARQWFDLLDAPSKEYIVFEKSGHAPPYDEPGRFAELMAN